MDLAFWITVLIIGIPSVAAIYWGFKVIKNLWRDACRYL